MVTSSSKMRFPEISERYGFILSFLAGNGHKADPQWEQKRELLQFLSSPVVSDISYPGRERILGTNIDSVKRRSS